MRDVTIVGSGIAGLSLAQMLKGNYKVRILEKFGHNGGMIHCKLVNNAVFHVVGGHVFNSRDPEVVDWFWSKFQKSDFIEAFRNSAIFIDKDVYNYPIENHLYQLDNVLLKEIINDWLVLNKENELPKNLYDFFEFNFGKTLANFYFIPYNEKIWNCDLRSISLEWLEDKLPMPQLEEQIFSNIKRLNETKMVHSFFYYPKIGGSQFLVNKLSDGLDILNGFDVSSIEFKNDKLWINGSNETDVIVYTGNLKNLSSVFKTFPWTQEDLNNLDQLAFHGTTTVLCECLTSDLSWAYLPSRSLKSHRIIFTGNFSKNNNGTYKNTCTLEFSSYMEIEDILQEINSIDCIVNYIDHYYSEYTYPIQNKNTRKFVRDLSARLLKFGVHLHGRFGTWEYDNMDVIIKKSMKITKYLLNGYENS